MFVDLENFKQSVVTLLSLSPSQYSLTISIHALSKSIQPYNLNTCSFQVNTALQSQYMLTDQENYPHNVVIVFPPFYYTVKPVLQ